MLRDYADITSRIPEKPIWYDEQGVPRYEMFTPDQLGIYDDLCCLQLIACQNCGEQFKVAHSTSKTWAWLHGNEPTTPAEIALSHYGDPPRHACVGDTMNVDLVEVIQVWQKKEMKWELDHEAIGNTNRYLKTEI